MFLFQRLIHSLVYPPKIKTHIHHFVPDYFLHFWFWGLDIWPISVDVDVGRNCMSVSRAERVFLYVVYFSPWVTETQWLVLRPWPFWPSGCSRVDFCRNIKYQQVHSDKPLEWCRISQLYTWICTIKTCRKYKTAEWSLRQGDGEVNKRIKQKIYI